MKTPAGNQAWTRRRVVGTGVGLWAGPVLAACQVGPGGGTDPALRPSEGPVKLTLLHAWGTVDRLPMMDKMKDGFQARNPRITVEYDVVSTAQGMNSPRVQKLITSAAGGAPPDVSMIWRGELPALATQSLLQPLDPFVQRDRFNPKMYYDAEWGTSRYQNKTYVLPNVSAGAWYMVYYNRTHFREAGIGADQPAQTWDQYSDYVRRLTKMEGGVITRLGGNLTGGGAGFLLWSLNNNGRYLSDDSRKVLFNSAEAIEGLEWMGRFFDPIGGRNAVNAWSATQGSTPATVPFVIGTQAMDIQNPSRIGHVKINAPTLDFGIASPPHSPKAKEGRGYIRGGWSYGVPTGVKHPYESWLLTHWLSATKEAAGWFMQQQLRPSPMKEVNEDKYFVDNLGPAWTQMLKGMERDVAFPITPVDAEIDGALDKMVNAVLGGQTSARDGVGSVAQEVQRLLDDFWTRQGK